MRAHEAARDAMKSICPHLKVGLTLSLHDIQSISDGEDQAQKAGDEEFNHYLPYIQADDFFGLQNYTHAMYGKEGALPTAADAEKTQMGYEYYPQALENVIRRVNPALRKEILISKNGIATADDARRRAFITEALNGVASCQKGGIPVKAYLYRSLFDNFEWQKGYSMTFGLIGVDRNTLQRTPKQGLYTLGKLGQAKK